MTVRGERSRHFGDRAAPDQSLSAATSNLSSDLYFAGVRRAGTVEKLLRQPAPAGPSSAVKELMRGWAAGYNAWLRQHHIKAPACAGASWVRPVSTLDVARRAFALAVLDGQGKVVDGITAAEPPGAGGPARRASPRGAGGRAAVDAVRTLFSQDGSDMGSNAVAFRGSTTVNGRGLLLGNPHYPWSGGRRFWQSQVTIPGELDAAGGPAKTEGKWDPAAGGYDEVITGSSYIQAVGFNGSRCPVARTLLTYSQSSDPSSAHYSDQTELYAAGRMVRERFCAKDIAAAPGLRVLHVRP